MQSSHYQNLSTIIRDSLHGEQLRTRFAPGVTGRLHMGHVANALLVWGISGSLGGETILRLEDHARDRWSVEFEESILGDIENLGFRPDEGAIAEFRSGKPSDFRRSDCHRHYQSALDFLRESHRVYACDCLEPYPLSSWKGRYDGRCRKRGLVWKPGMRLRVELPETSSSFLDARLGRQEFPPKNGDLEIINPLGNWTYRFCVVVDDHRHRINTVVRGRSFLESTAEQVALAEMLELKPVKVWLHHEELMDDSTGRKLSKREGAQPIEELLAKGARPGQLIGEAAFQFGLISELRDIPARAVAQLFS